MLNFVTFEGVDGCGKSTQVKMLAQHLARRLRGRSVLTVHEPGGTGVGDHVRAILLDPCHTSMCVQCEVLLYLASRAQLVEEKIRPAIAKGDLVLSDRYYDATVAYQGYGRGVSLEDLDRLQLYASEGLVPDLTFLLDLDPQIGRERIASGRGHAGQPAAGDRMEREGIAFAHKVREGYLRLASDAPDRFRVLDASRSPEEVFTDVSNEMERHGL